MEKFSQAVFSMKMMALAMIVFLLAIATATFLESYYDIQTAKIIIYNAKWFEFLLLYLGLNLIANIFRYRMFQREKAAMLMFHLSFLVILIGAGITRYLSFEGMMLIREGEQSDFIFTSDPYLWFKVNDGKMQFQYSEKKFMSPVTNNDFAIDFDFPNHPTPISIEYVDFKKKMVDSLVINDSIKESSLDIVTEGMQSHYLSKGGFLMAGTVAISFEKKDAMPGIQLYQRGETIMMRSNKEMRYLPMEQMRAARQAGIDVPETAFTKVPSDSLVPFLPTTLYRVDGQQIVFKQLIKHAKMMLLPSGNKKVGADYLTVKIKDGKHSQLVELKGGMGAIPTQQVFVFNGLVYEMEYGSAKRYVPFAIACRDFQLDRYPGSMTASSFASEVTILDPKNNYTRNQRIFMNNVMDYKGYRFFQSSYDPDEKGTRLSVNYDWWGTTITYLGYLLMTIGMAMSFFSTKSRFKELNKLLKKNLEKRRELIQVLVVLLAFGTSFSANAQHQHGGSSPKMEIISVEHSEKLATLLVEDYNGRIIPFHTLCDQLLSKVHRANTYEKYNAVQTILSMHMYPQHWIKQKVIQVPANLREYLKVKEFASYTELADPNGQFKWMKAYNDAHQRPEAKRDEFDKKIIKLVEKFQVMRSILEWRYMKIIPSKNDSNNTWYHPLDERLMEKDTVSFRLVLNYLRAVSKAIHFNRYGEADDILKDFKALQRKIGKKVVPTENHINTEVLYTKMHIFKNTMYSYFSLGMVLLILFFIRTFTKPTPENQRLFKKITTVFVALLVVVFVYHAVGLGFRWYISGHVPWSNGYEALVFIAWMAMLVGFLFTKRNPAILAATAILAFMMIFVTDMELLDPEITPLQPVLKSNWLKIHVAVITSSYAFLGLAAMLGFLNMCFYMMRTRKNANVLTLNINELTYVTEIIITIGLFLLTIGTFLGGVWANESWGRYWGWDPKETWALVSVLVYAVILHLRYIPALRGKFVFNVVAFWGFSSILFTFFGVNFYLTGLHSYAQGDELGAFPTWLTAVIIAFTAFTVIAIILNTIYTKKTKGHEFL